MPLSEQQSLDDAAVAFMDENNIPQCVECGSTRDLHHCWDCTEAGDGIDPICGACLPAYQAELDCEGWMPIPESFRFGQRLSDLGSAP